MSLRIGIDYGGVLCVHNRGNRDYYNQQVNVGHGASLNMPGALDFLKTLKDKGHELYLISYCGVKLAGKITKEIPDGLFTKLFFTKTKNNKAEVVKHLSCDVMIDDTLTILINIHASCRTKPMLIWFQGDPSFSDKSRTRLRIHTTRTFEETLDQISKVKPSIPLEYPMSEDLLVVPMF